MFCNGGLCSCLTTYIAAEGYCYQKIDPGQPGCVYNEQCASVWPDAFCDTSAGVGTCRCGENKVERATRDGHVCLDVLDANQNTLAITCPLPEGAGYTSALSDPKHPRQSDGPGPVLCNTDSTSTNQADENVACSRGAPEYVHRSSFLEQTPVSGCSQTSACSYNFECKNVGSTQWCCPSVASVCGPVGGRPLDPSVNIRGTVYHTGVEKQGTATSTRFYYDPQSGKCSPFTYLGAGGNYNNFLSRIDCELYCARLQCDRGNPLRIGDVTQSCASNNDCPSSHECKMDQAVCCPRMQTICTQPLRVGNCDRSVRRYWYSAATRECQSFEYTGCQGNDNNFETLVDCQTFCKNAARWLEQTMESEPTQSATERISGRHFEHGCRKRISQALPTSAR
uniref:BPTI/Kunitz inhibitor domain-containing protein n=1 Tax=Caenorhabditis japonica TaxID=281687 RepID=A0A8R1IMY9_CAEJA